VIRCFDESEFVDLRINAKGKRSDRCSVLPASQWYRDGRSVYSERRAPRTRRVHATDRRTQRGDTAFVRELRQRVGLVHELRQLVRPEECIDHRRQCLGVDQVHRCENLVVTDVHAFADGTGHPGETDTKLVVQLLSHSPDTAVAQVVDVVDLSLALTSSIRYFNNGNDVFLGQYLVSMGISRLSFRLIR